METSRSFRLLRSTIGRIIISTIAILLLSILIAWLILRSGWMTPDNQIYILAGLLILSSGTLGVCFYLFVYRKNQAQLIHIQRSIDTIFEDPENAANSDGLPEEYTGITRSIETSKANINSYAQTIAGLAQGDFATMLSSTHQKGTLPAKLFDLAHQLKNTFSRVDGSLQHIQVDTNQILQEGSANGDSLAYVYTTLQQMASNSDEQSKSVHQTAESIGQLTHAIQGVAEGAQDQASAVAKAAQITSMMTETIQLVSESIRMAAKKSDDASNTARLGTKTVEQTVTGMMQIKQKVDETAQKIALMAEHSEKIGEIVGTIDDISSQTNLLALNAAIEAARAESQAEALIEYLLNKQMLSQAQLVNQVLLDGENRPPTFWADLARQSGLDVISVANADGVNVYSSDERLIGFRYSDDPKEQSYAFRKMIIDGSGYVCQPPKKRNIDGKLFKYVGVVRKDQPGAIQVGFNAESLSSFKLQVGGFAVVANEVYRLAENSKESAHEISRLVREMQKRMDEVKNAMQMSTLEVEKGFANADEANKALLAIVDSTNEVSRESVLAAEEAEKMTAYADDLVSSVDSVSAVVEENTATTEEMAAHSNEVNQAMDSIALVSSKNSEAIGQALKFMEEARITSEKINARTKGLQQSTADLLSTLQYFNLKENQGI